MKNILQLWGELVACASTTQTTALMSRYISDVEKHVIHFLGTWQSLRTTDIVPFVVLQPIFYGAFGSPRVYAYRSV
jgi:hypothetical protein